MEQKHLIVIYILVFFGLNKNINTFLYVKTANFFQKILLSKLELHIT